MASAPIRPVLKPKTALVPIDQLVKMDIEDLMLKPAFLRFMFTTFRDCGMFSGSFHPEAGAQHYAEGRRGLGLDMLRRLEDASPDALMLVLAEAATHKEANNANRRNQHDRNRNRELGNDDLAGDDVDRGNGDQIIRYDGNDE